ncbi:DUF1849 family protein [Martelella lutilitoris]|uniref:DUF1849 family protein n=1 Tax=Martelella lutilitoris TaxID=2583532 RepID=A0A5C4JMI9_9HYPH|nr:DUF1849 family protein [Martelella lutilitoris]TNB46673.1 DUF1849 family protein [Martelella lutilitoris]
MRTVMGTGIFWTILAAGAQAAGPAFDAVSLLPHRAVYDLSLEWASAQSGVEGLDGRFVYSFTGSDCAGYVTEMRMVTDIAREYGAVVTDQVSSSFEEKGAFAFSSTLFSDNALQSETVGEAQRTEKRAISVTFGGDEARAIELQDAEFPTEYMANVILAAQNGRRAYEAISFDGSGEETMRAITLIGDREDRIEGDAGWPITTAYFPMGAVSGDETPDYTVSMLLSAEGVSRDIVMDFGDFKMAGELTRLEPLKPAGCEAPPETLSSKP